MLKKGGAGTNAIRKFYKEYTSIFKRVLTRIQKR
jgi:hypothetical protein